MEAVPYSRGAWTDVWYGTISNALPAEKEFRILGSITLPWEHQFFGSTYTQFTRSYYWLAPLACVLYAIFIVVGPKLMENRKPFGLRRELAAWNLFLAVFSFMGMMRTVPQLLLWITKYGFFSSICTPAGFVYGHNACGVWVMLFNWSKFFELIDTAFIVLRKKDLKFLHWYHHLTVLIYTWDAYCQEMPIGIHFIAMNYTVHAVMYFYYFLGAATGKPPSWGLPITIMQIVQMIAGMISTGLGLYYSSILPQVTAFPTTLPPPSLEGESPLDLDYFQANGCAISRVNNYFGLVIYGSYFYLFVDFFVQRYLKKGKGKSKKGE